VEAGQISTADDRYRAEVCQLLFFMPSAIPPNLWNTEYAFLDPTLAQAQEKFKRDLQEVSRSLQDNNNKELPWFMPLTSDDHPLLTIPASIQY
jgi:hypothetical protein